MVLCQCLRYQTLSNFADVVQQNVRSPLRIAQFHKTNLGQKPYGFAIAYPHQRGRTEGRKAPSAKWPKFKKTILFVSCA
ncbi:hypothetical protein ACQ4M4_06865 [Leptolyngbya sp. AN02str]|uniref:hypothetical protein n=1 Tax=Leptolyngbya sp. AN02str TaxID=3423363 RepID=UPI003D31136C